MGPILLAFALAVLAWLLVVGDLVRRHHPAWHWYVTGYPVTACRVLATWRKVAMLNDLAVSRRPPRGLLGDLVVKGDPLRPVAPRASFPRATRLGLTVTVRLHAGQTPATYLKAADALVHAWKVHAVRVTSPERGLVLLTATATDPLQRPGLATAPAELLSALIGALETGGAWVMNLRLVPHWLIAGATRSGKSTLLARLITQFASQPVALVGIDCKGGMELGLFAGRLSALATCRREAVAILFALVVDMQDRMSACRAAGSPLDLGAARQAAPDTGRGDRRRDRRAVPVRRDSGGQGGSGAMLHPAAAAGAAGGRTRPAPGRRRTAGRL